MDPASLSVRFHKTMGQVNAQLGTQTGVLRAKSGQEMACCMSTAQRWSLLISFFFNSFLKKIQIGILSDLLFHQKNPDFIGWKIVYCMEVSEVL